MSADVEKEPLLVEQTSLAELQQNMLTAQRAYIRAWSRTTSGRWHRRIMAAVSIAILVFMIFSVGVIIEDHSRTDREGWPRWNASRVQLEASGMSKCPDWKDCLHDLILPAMPDVADMVDFRLSYIGKYVAPHPSPRVVARADDHCSSTDNGGVACMHGQEECTGNMIELCAADLYPDPKIHLGFVMCMTRDYHSIPDRELVEDCALEHSISMDKLNGCLNEDDGAKAIDMLKASFNRTKEAGVKKSCTVRLNGEFRCIRDGGEWKDCDGGSKPEDLVADIKKLYYDSDGK